MRFPFRKQQPSVTKSEAWTLPQDPHQGVYLTGPVAEGTLRVLRVVHDDDGDLQFLDNVHDVDYDAARLVCLHDALALDTDLRDVVQGLPAGHAMERESVGSPWQLWTLPSQTDDDG